MQRIVILVLVLAFVALAEIDHAREIAREHEGFIAVCETADRLQRALGIRDEYIRRCEDVFAKHRIPRPQWPEPRPRPEPQPGFIPGVGPAPKVSTAENSREAENQLAVFCNSFFGQGQSTKEDCECRRSSSSAPATWNMPLGAPA